MLGFVKRISSDFTNVSTLRILYFAFVRSHLELCSIVWVPYYKVHWHVIEKVQHKFLRHIAFKFGIHFDRWNCDYNNLQDIFNLSSLWTRRVQTDLKFLFKCLNDIINCNDLTLLFTSNFYASLRLTRQNIIFYIPSSRTNYHKHTSINRIMTNANTYTSLSDYNSRSFPAFIWSLSAIVY